MNRSEKEKLREIYGKYKNRMYITACRILKDPFLAEDAVHDTFVAVSRHIDKLSDIDSVKTASYLVKAVKNRSLNIIRKNDFEIPVLYGDRDFAADEESLDEICSEENYSFIVNAIKALDEKYRDVLSLYYLNELSVKEIGVALGKKESTVKSQLVRGRRILIQNIEKECKFYEEAK